MTVSIMRTELKGYVRKWPFVIPSALLDEFLLDWKQQPRAVLWFRGVVATFSRAWWGCVGFGVCSCSILHKGDYIAEVEKKRHLWGQLPRNANFLWDGFFLNRKFICDSYKYFINNCLWTPCAVQVNRSDNLTSIKKHFLMFSAPYLKAEVVRSWQQCVGALVTVLVGSSELKPIAPCYLLLLHKFKNIFASFKTLASPPMIFTGTSHGFLATQYCIPENWVR